MDHLTCWIGLDDVDRENGCMYYIPKSHKWGLLEKESLTGDMDAIREKLTPEQVADFDNKIPVQMKAGEASFITLYSCMDHMKTVLIGSVERL